MDHGIEINTAIFPMIMSLALGKPIQKGESNEDVASSSLARVPGSTRIMSNINILNE